MASVFKLPLAMAVLDRTHLDDPVTVEPSSVRPYRSPIAERAPKGGIIMTVGELLEAMIVESDNTAADLLLDLTGGPRAVNNYLHKLQVDGIRIDRSEGQMALDYAGVTAIPPKSDWSLEWFIKAMAAVPKEQQKEAARRFLAEDRDTASPDEMIKLLRLLVQGKALLKSRTDLLLDLMQKTVPAAGRIKAGVPAGTVVAHRPGTGGDNEGINLCTNDVAIIGNHLLLAIFLKGSTQDEAARDQTIAQIARAIYGAK